MSRPSSDCLICRGPVSVVLDLGPQPASNRFQREADTRRYTHPLVVGRCEACGLIQLIDPMPAGEVRPRFDWIQYNEPEAHLDEVADRIADGNELDRGASIGGLTYKDASTLQRLRDRGYRNTCLLRPGGDLGIVDPHAGLETIQERLTPEAARAIARRYGRFDLLIARHILEHTHDPRGFLAAARELVTPAGHVIFEVPSFEKCTLSYDYCFLWEEHLSYYIRETFRSSLTLQGWAWVELFEYEYTFENSLVGLLRADGPGSSPALEEHPSNLAVPFGEAFSARKAAVRRVLSSFRAEKGRVAIFGAGHLACKFLNFFELGDLIEFVVDHHPGKQGLRMPGSALPIKKSAELDSEKIGLVIMSLSPESEERVLAQHRDRISAGMRFVSMFEASSRSLMKELPA